MGTDLKRYSGLQCQQRQITRHADHKSPLNWPLSADTWTWLISQLTIDLWDYWIVCRSNQTEDKCLFSSFSKDIIIIIIIIFIIIIIIISYAAN